MYLEYIKMCLRSKKGIEGLPLKYVVIILVAAIVIGIVLTMTSTLEGGIVTSTEVLNNTMAERVNATIQ